MDDAEISAQAPEDCGELAGELCQSTADGSDQKESVRKHKALCYMKILSYGL